MQKLIALMCTQKWWVGEYENIRILTGVLCCQIAKLGAVFSLGC